MIVYLSNFFNHHQQPLAEELYRLTGGNFRFIETMPMPESFKKAGYPEYDNSDMIVKARNHPEEARRLILESEVLINGGVEEYDLIKERLEKGLLTFEVGERWLKRGIINVLSPRFLRHQYAHHIKFRNKVIYRLNAGAYCAEDLLKFRCLKGRMFKWGYFTDVPETISRDFSRVPEKGERVRMLYVGRFLRWKHAELPVEMVKNLTAKGYDIELNMYGAGPTRDSIQRLIERYNLTDRIHLPGNLENRAILKEMSQHDIFLFTSDRNEGWGAVANEAMSQGCVVIASEACGATPYLIKDGENGLIFKNRSAESLTEKAEELICFPRKMASMQKAARATMLERWSPRTAARRLLTLIEQLKKSEPSPYREGPCSPA